MGVDLSKVMVEVARERYPEATFIQVTESHGVVAMCAFAYMVQWSGICHVNQGWNACSCRFRRSTIGDRVTPHDLQAYNGLSLMTLPASSSYISFCCV